MKLYTEKQIEISRNKVFSTLPDKDFFDNSMFQKYNNVEITYDFTKKDLKRIHVNDTRFVNCIFRAAAATGSKFIDTTFNNCDLSGTNFQYCYFKKCHFNNGTVIKGANFSHSVFVECSFESVTIIESTLFDCSFESCILESSTIKSDTLENSIMRNCDIRDINLAHINLEYMSIDDIHMNNIQLPPYQVPYIIGAPEYLIKTSDKVYIETDRNELTCQDYCKLYDDLAIYFYSQREYFPLANLHIALGNHDRALEYIRLGIREACDFYDFRMVKHLCKLACSNKLFSHIQLKQIYDMITDISFVNDWDVNILHSYLLNIGEIKELLLNNSVHKERVEFVLKTNIDKDDLTSINSLYNQINSIIRENCSTTHVDSIELRHNSPYELYITCIDKLPHILLFISTMYSTLAVGNKFLDIYKNFEETRRVHQQNQLFKYEKEEKKLDIELKKLQLEQMKKDSDKSSQENISSIYLINEIEHNIKCSSFDIAQNMAPEYLHYKYSRNIPER